MAKARRVPSGRRASDRKVAAPDYEQRRASKTAGSRRKVAIHRGRPNRNANELEKQNPLRPVAHCRTRVSADRTRRGAHRQFGTHWLFRSGLSALPAQCSCDLSVGQSIEKAVHNLLELLSLEAEKRSAGFGEPSQSSVETGNDDECSRHRRSHLINPRGPPRKRRRKRQRGTRREDSRRREERAFSHKSEYQALRRYSQLPQRLCGQQTWRASPAKNDAALG